MGRRKKGRAINGIVLIDKPQGGSSNNILQKVRAIYNAQKAGHTGALDPLATGMLPICLGEATKFSQYLLDSEKSYFVTAKLGERTDTSDADGEIVETKGVYVTLDQILQHKASLTGPIMQVPTMFSALKHNGQPLYKLARQGITVDRPARPITIFEFELVEFRQAQNEIDFNVRCSKGTYIRTLIDDLGQLLGCGAHVKVLRRTQVANYPAEKMLTLEQVQAFKDNNFINGDAEQGVDYTELDSHLLPMETALIGMPKLQLTEKAVATLRFGQTVPIDEVLIDMNNDVAQLLKEQAVELMAFCGDEFIGVVETADEGSKSESGDTEVEVGSMSKPVIKVKRLVVKK